MTLKNQVKVLVVDDEQTYRLIFEELFYEQGWWVISADNVQEAKGYIKSHFFHAALVDIRLESLNVLNEEGFEILTTLRNSEELTGAMVITGYPTGERYRRAFRDIGVLDFFEKRSYEEQEIINQVKKAYEISEHAFRAKISGLHDEDYFQGINLKIFEQELTGNLGQHTMTILKKLLNPAYPFIRSNTHQQIDERGPNPILSIHYWSRRFGTAIKVDIGEKEQIYNKYKSLSDDKQYSAIETIDGLSGIRYACDDFTPVDFS